MLPIKPIDYISQLKPGPECITLRFTSGLKRRPGTGKRRCRSVMIPLKLTRIYRQKVDRRRKLYAEMKDMTKGIEIDTMTLLNMASKAPYCNSGYRLDAVLKSDLDKEHSAVTSNALR